jgi:hypothetical protein
LPKAVRFFVFHHNRGFFLHFLYYPNRTTAEKLINVIEKE